ncbi:hypothetical protein ACTFIU_008494 [Dictyostelium citrinum]
MSTQMHIQIKHITLPGIGIVPFQCINDTLLLSEIQEEKVIKAHHIFENRHLDAEDTYKFISGNNFSITKQKVSDYIDRCECNNQCETIFYGPKTTKQVSKFLKHT